MVERIVVIALAVFFLHVTTWEGMINEWVRKPTFNWPAWVKKPLYDCPICMTPWWGGLIIALGGMPFYGLWDVALTLASAAGLNTVLIYMVSLSKEEIQELKEDDYGD